MADSPAYQRFFAELKRRKVFRVAAVYGGTGFVVLQVADLLAQSMELPSIVLKITTFVVLLGFPIAMVLAWAFELTPEGVKRTDAADAEEITAIVSHRPAVAGRRASSRFSGSGAPYRCLVGRTKHRARHRGTCPTWRAGTRVAKRERRRGPATRLRRP